MSMEGGWFENTPREPSPELESMMRGEFGTQSFGKKLAEEKSYTNILFFLNNTTGLWMEYRECDKSKLPKADSDVPGNIKPEERAQVLENRALARRFIQSEEYSFEYFSMLLAVMKKIGCDFPERGKIQRYFDDRAAVNAEYPGLKKLMDNLATAMVMQFPAFGRDVDDGKDDESPENVPPPIVPEPGGAKILKFERRKKS